MKVKKVMFWNNTVPTAHALSEKLLLTSWSRAEQAQWWIKMEVLTTSSSLSNDF